MLPTGGLGVGALVTGGLGGRAGGGLPPPPPIPTPLEVTGGGGGGPGGGRGWFPQEIPLGPIDAEDVLFQLNLLDFDPIPMSDLGLDPEEEGAQGSADVTGPPLEDEVEEAPPPRRSRAPAKKKEKAKAKKKGPSKGLKRAAKVAIGAGSLYLAGRGLKQVSDAAESGSIVKLAKGLAKLGSVRSLGESGVKSVLDGLSGSGEDDDDTEG